MTAFEVALADAHRRRIPVIALRPDHEFPDELDDIVVENVKVFRAEAMDHNIWWMACYFANGEELVFHVTRAAKPSRIVVTASSIPEHIDWDELYRKHREDRERTRIDHDNFVVPGERRKDSHG